MKKLLTCATPIRRIAAMLSCMVCMMALQPSHAQTSEVSAVKINPTTVDVVFGDERMTLDFYGDNIFRLFQDNTGGVIRDPEARPEARILVENPRRKVSALDVEDKADAVVVSTPRVEVAVDKATRLMRVTDRESGRTVVEQVAPVEFGDSRVTVVLGEEPQEYFYGGGVQNGRFSHKGKIIAIENQNSWTDGGVASPAPFYWSTRGYGVMWYTFRKGAYDFGATETGRVSLSHDTDYLDLFIMVDSTPVALLNDYYQLTGNPVLLPKFGFYQGHLNAYNRDYWTEDEKGILFEDGKRYKESQRDNGGVKESLNGEKDNYQFSARAVIDRYAAYDMPLGWLLPNDGYGAGYGQEETLDGNIRNLKSLGDYARGKGVEIGLWTQSDLHPKPEVSALLQRDIVKEVRDAGVRVLKTDVAWVGAGYSFGLNGIADVAQIMPYYGGDARPFIISLDGWAGTQRYAGVWTGDQTGGEWEYIRFHIPTYIGSGLSGQPNITSDMDGIFGGRNLAVNTRDFQWKTFSPMELNMDGWGSNEKYPHALGEPATSINRWYLKLKSEIMPYAYSIAHEAVDGMPMIRAMMLEWPNAYTLGTATRYQYMYGPWFLVAPVYQQTAADNEGNDIRDGIYLPEGEWIDYFSGEMYEGGRVINNYEAPLWKLPLFVRNGAVIPMTNPNNNVSQIDRTLRIYEIYPSGHTSFTEYDDDGTTEAYRRGEFATTYIESEAVGDRVTVTIHPSEGDFAGFERMKRTELRINVTAEPDGVKAYVDGRRVKLQKAASVEEFAAADNAWYYEPAPDMNRFATAGSEFADVKVVKNPVLHVRLAAADVTSSEQRVVVDGFVFAPEDHMLTRHGALQTPALTTPDDNVEAYAVTPVWTAVDNADYYEIEFDSMLYSTVRSTELLFADLEAETDYTFRVRAVNADGVSDWGEQTLRTKANPLEFAITGITGTSSAAAQGGAGINRLFDFVEAGDVWHTLYNTKAVPFELTIDLHTVNTLDRFDYLPRLDSGNGTILEGSVAYSMDRNTWTEAGGFSWKRDAETKSFTFDGHPAARYVRIRVTKAVGDYGSGREIYVFRVPGSESYIQGDVNNDGKVDGNDLTSYMNYTGLRLGDSDFEGYISRGDIDGNNMIDAYDISVAATQLEGGVQPSDEEHVAGEVILSANGRSFKAGDEVEIRVSGRGMKAVNALSFALPYDQQSYDFVGIETVAVKGMENLTNDRLHTDGEKVLYPTFVNVGDKPAVEGDVELFVIRLKAKGDVQFDLKARNGVLIDKSLNRVTF